MILHESQVEQTVDRDERGQFIKQLVVVRSRAASSPREERPVALARAGDSSPPSRRGVAREIPLAMVRKRSVGGAWGHGPAEGGATRGGGGAPGTIASVLLIHGYGQNRYVWHLPSRSFSNYLAQAGFDVFNLDLRGHGRSRHLGAKLPSDVTDFVREDVPAAVDEIRRISGPRPVYLIGHSLGGLVAYAAATLLGDKVGGVVTGQIHVVIEAARRLGKGRIRHGHFGVGVV